MGNAQVEAAAGTSLNASSVTDLMSWYRTLRGAVAARLLPTAALLPQPAGLGQAVTGEPEWFHKPCKEWLTSG